MYSLSLMAVGDTLRVLCIGNSFSIDAVEQELLPLAEAEKVPIRIGNLYIPGCSLKQHATNAMQAAMAYSFRELYGKTRIVTDSVSLQYALQQDRWDIITMQQASHDSGLWETYEPWLQILIDTIRSYCPKARLAWHETWAYSEDATHPGFANYHHSQKQMFRSIGQCTDSVMANYPFETLISTGKAIQLARKGRLGDTLCRDGFHLRFEYGRYLAACVWLEALTGIKPGQHHELILTWYAYPDQNGVYQSVKNRDIRTSHTERLCRKAAHKAVKKVKSKE